MDWCFVLALQESDRETQELQQQLKAAAEEHSRLQAAVQAATAQQCEHEQLVSDLTHAVQQQKAQIQVRHLPADVHPSADSSQPEPAAGADVQYATG